jgi:uncharacterized protein (TIGR04222 family)
MAGRRHNEASIASSDGSTDMSGLAAAGDTWGISGPTFLTYFLAVAAVVVVGSFLHRTRLFAGRRDSSRRRLTSEQAAYLNRGPRLAVYAALGGLRSAGATGRGTDGSLAQTGSLPAGSTALDQAIYHAAGSRVRPRQLAAQQWVAGALDELRDRLERDGLAVTAEQRRAARTGPLVLLGLVAIGVLRAFAGVANGRPVGFLVVAIAVLATAALVQLFRVPTSTRVGREALKSLQAENRYLSPSRYPSYATYGATGAALGIALFGTASLYAMDPTFAAGAEVQRQFAGGGDGGASVGGATASSGCGGSSCGGGGCGGGGCGG